VTMWLAMDHVNEENGCVRYVRGSHKRGVRPHGASGTLGFSQTMLDFPNADDKENEVYFTLKPGDLLVHHALTIHWADGNQSPDRTRKALGFIYFSQRAKRNMTDAKTFQGKIYEEWKANGKL
jgi:phytanoyl-CoA hydroxylase